MTVVERAQKIIDDGMKEEDLISFFFDTDKDIEEYVFLFAQLRGNVTRVWNAYEVYLEANHDDND